MIHKTQDPKKRPPNFKRDLRKVGCSYVFFSILCLFKFSRRIIRICRPVSEWIFSGFNPANFVVN